MSLGKNIVKAREAASMSQADLAVKIGKSRASVCEYESDKHAPRLDVLVAIAGACSVSLDDLMKPDVIEAPADSTVADDEQRA